MPHIRTMQTLVAYSSSCCICVIPCFSWKMEKEISLLPKPMILTTTFPHVLGHLSILRIQTRKLEAFVCDAYLIYHGEQLNPIVYLHLRCWWQEWVSLTQSWVFEDCLYVNVLRIPDNDLLLWKNLCSSFPTIAFWDIGEKTCTLP